MLQIPPTVHHITLYTSNKLFWEEKGTWNCGSPFSSSRCQAFHWNKLGFFTLPSSYSLLFSLLLCHGLSLLFLPLQYQIIPPPAVFFKFCNSCICFPHAFLQKKYIYINLKNEKDIFFFFKPFMFLALVLNFSINLCPSPFSFGVNLELVAACSPIIADYPDNVSVSHSSQKIMTMPSCPVTRDTVGSSSLNTIWPCVCPCMSVSMYV